LARRHILYLSAREANPKHWARHTRNWNPIATVTLNPEKESVISSALLAEKETASAA
jgi:putative transposase